MIISHTRRASAAWRSFSNLSSSACGINIQPNNKSSVGFMISKRIYFTFAAASIFCCSSRAASMRSASAARLKVSNTGQSYHSFVGSCKAVTHITAASIVVIVTGLALALRRPSQLRLLGLEPGLGRRQPRFALLAQGWRTALF